IWNTRTVKQDGYSYWRSQRLTELASCETEPNPAHRGLALPRLCFTRSIQMNVRTAFLAITVGVAALLPITSSAQSDADPIIADGTCDPQSGVTIDGDKSDFACDVAVILRA